MNEPYVNYSETEGIPPDKALVREITLKVTEKIIRDTSYSFKNEKDGSLSEEPLNEADPENHRLASAYLDWKYWNGVIYLAINELSGSFNRQDLREYVGKNFRFMFKHLDFFKILFDKRIPAADFHQFFRLDRLDDFGSMGAALIEHHDHEPEETYRKKIMEWAGYLKNRQDRLDDGTFCRRRFAKTTLWVDDLYMSVPFLVRLFKLTGEDHWLEDAILQAYNFNTHLFDPQKGLYHHSWCLENDAHGVACWGRANGWAAMGLVNLLDYIPADHPDRDPLIRLLFEQIIGFSRYQGKTGMWHQLLDKTDSFPETSCSAMFVYTVARAVNKGWIDDMYASIAVRGWAGLTGNISDQGEVGNVSTGFNIRQDLSYYYNRPVEPGGAHGLGAVLLAGSELWKLNAYRDCIWC